MNRHVAMSLFETVVLLDVMEIVTADDDSPLHLHLLNDSGENTSTNRNISSEGAFLVKVRTLNGL